ncbi:alpha/beta hydrolase [Candidatus Woesearchaeota archaeon]|nr:alpha/beta hydrolase [Candidatus Woesearchaeota archaeon]
MKSKTQIVIVHGGMTFKNRKDYLHYLKTRPISLEKKVRWSGDYLDKKLGNSVDIIRLSMPRPEDAKYKEWKIHFERYLPHFDKKVILIGSSLGGIFLAKYLSENKFPKKILSTYLICPPYDSTLAEEDLVGGFKLKSNLFLLEKNSKNLYLMFSKDDDIVPVQHAEKYAQKLKYAKIIIFKSKNGHFKIETFPEIVKLIKEDLGLK